MKTISFYYSFVLDCLANFQETVAGLFASLASKEENIQILSSLPGAITTLVSQMENGTNICKERSASALERLTGRKRNRFFSLFISNKLEIHLYIFG